MAAIPRVSNSFSRKEVLCLEDILSTLKRSHESTTSHVAISHLAPTYHGEIASILRKVGKMKHRLLSQ